MGQCARMRQSGNGDGNMDKWRKAAGQFNMGVKQLGWDVQDAVRNPLRQLADKGAVGIAYASAVIGSALASLAAR